MNLFRDGNVMQIQETWSWTLELNVSVNRKMFRLSCQDPLLTLNNQITEKVLHVHGTKDGIVFQQFKTLLDDE